MFKKVKTITLLASVTLLSACGSLSPVATTPIQTYRLSADTTPTQQGNNHGGVIFVGATPAISGFNTTNMYYQEKPYQLESFVKNAWVSTPGNMIVANVVENLAQLQEFNGVLSTLNPGVYTDYSLNLRLLSLYQDFTQANSQIVFSVEVTLIDDKHNKVLGSKVFSYNQSCSENTPYGGVLAANQALSQFLSDLDQWLLTKVS